MLNSTLDFYRQLFETMKKNGILDISDVVHIAILRYCFGHLVKLDLERATSEWNNHRIRQQKNIKSPCGIPNIMYRWPEKYNARECKKPVNLAEIDLLINTRTKIPKLY